MQLSVGAIADILQTRPLYSKALSEEERDALARVMVRGASIDSRTVSEGDLFVCLKGEKVDGHAYAARACEAGSPLFRSLWSKIRKKPLARLRTQCACALPARSLA